MTGDTSQVCDLAACRARYRLHRHTWEKGRRKQMHSALVCIVCDREFQHSIVLLSNTPHMSTKCHTPHTSTAHHTRTDCLAVSTMVCFFCAKVMPLMLGRCRACCTSREQCHTEQEQHNITQFVSLN